MSTVTPTIGPKKTMHTGGVLFSLAAVVDNGRREKRSVREHGVQYSWLESVGLWHTLYDFMTYCERK